MIKKSKYLKVITLLKIINLFIIILFFTFYYIIYVLKMKNYNILIQKIKNFENNNIITDYNIKEFRTINSKNILLYNEKFKKAIHPDITIILIVYNQAHCLHKALRSIQNQSIKNLEIIIIDDGSLDNSTDIIKKYQKEDERIILIEHECNKGKIKSRSDGIRLANGKYITCLDGDDALIHKNILKNSLYIANLGDLDIVEFKILIFKNETKRLWLNKYITNTDDIIYQPKLRTKFFYLKGDNKYRAFLIRNICGKFVKNEILKKVVDNIGPKYTEDFILSYEDTIMAISLLQMANSYYYMKESGYYYSKDEKKPILFKKKFKNCKFNKTIIRGMDHIKLLQFFVEKTKNNKIERQLAYYEIMSINHYTHFYRYINHDFKMVYDILDKMIKSRFLSIYQKKELIFIKKALEEKEKKEKLNFTQIYK